MMRDSNRLEFFAEVFAIAAFFVFVTSAVAALSVLATILLGGV